MSAEAIGVFERYIELFNRAMAGENLDPFEVFDEDCGFFCPGQTTFSGHYTSLAKVKEAIFGTVVQNMKREPGFGFYVEEYIGQGDRMVALLRGRGESKLGRAYNNVYFFLFEVRDGKIVDAIEGCDSSLVNYAILDMNIAPRAAN